jgi:hypothetical protein
MMRWLLLVLACLGGAALVAAVRWQPADTGMPIPVEPVTHAGGMLDHPAPDSIAHAMEDAAAFRERRVKTRIAFDPSQPAGAPAPPQPEPARPPIQLVGIVWGSHPMALVDGIPGVDGSRAMQRGDTAGGLRLRRITPGSVVMTGYDTTWTLRVREFR